MLANPPARTAQQIELFSSDRWPKKPYCSDDIEQGVVIRSLASAIRKPYLQANPPHLRVWSIFDVDRPGAAIAWEDANLPPPSWASANRMNGHAHLVWGLSAPVLVDAADARRAPMRYLAAVEAAFRAKLQADQGYSGLITKNPAHPLWRTLRGPVLSYDLGELAEYVDIDRFKPQRGKLEEVGLGRNCTLFDWLRRWAYVAVRRHRATRNFVVWQAECYDKALGRNGDFAAPLDPREVWHIAKSVSKWVWARDAEAHAAFSSRQAERGRQGGLKGGAVRSDSYEEKRACARLMRASGKTVSNIAEELGVSRPSVYAWTRDV